MIQQPTYDIVQRLLEGRTNGTDLRWAVTAVHVEAAEEIERLRERVAILEAELRVAYQLPNAIDRAFEQEPGR